MTRTCQQPDHDVPGVVCGRPIPCVYHTVILHTDKEPATVEMPITMVPRISPKQRRLLKDVAKAISEDS